MPPSWRCAPGKHATSWHGLHERGTDATAWALLIDTLLDRLAAARDFRVGERYELSAGSLLLFELLPEAA
jgi:hypothetical protein